MVKVKNRWRGMKRSTLRMKMQREKWAESGSVVAHGCVVDEVDRSSCFVRAVMRSVPKFLGGPFCAG